MRGLSEKNLDIFSKINYGLLIVMAIGLPVSKALTSIVPGLLLLNWLFEGRFRQKFQQLKQRPGILLLLSIFVFYIAGLIWTSSWQWGIHDVKIQLPLLILPLVIGSTRLLSYREVKYLIYFFSASVIVASLCSIWVLLGLSGKNIQDPREMSLFISHIRFALLINISIFALGWFLFNCEKKPLYEKALVSVAIVWLSAFLIILRSATGWVVFLLVLFAVTIYLVFLIRRLWVKIVLVTFLLCIILFPLGYIGYVFQQFYSIEKIPDNYLHEKTRLRNDYVHDLNNKELENGHYTYLFLNESEMRESWSKRSKLHYDSFTEGGFNRFVLIRYLTSKGFRKDAEGLEKLSDQDIRNIENGMTNYRFADSFSFYKRIYQVIWELDVYRKGGDPAGHSVSQRFEYYKMAIAIIKEDFWLGKGTGGYYPAYEEKYNQNQFFKGQEYRQRSHNMFLSYWIDFGLIGMCYICFALIAPVFVEHKTRSFLLLTFLLIVLLSFLNEDTLNNHDAITFFSLFYPLYLCSKHENPNEDESVPAP